jgi:hypothetical protein
LSCLGICIAMYIVVRNWGLILRRSMLMEVQGLLGILWVLQVLTVSSNTKNWQFFIRELPCMPKGFNISLKLPDLLCVRCPVCWYSVAWDEASRQGLPLWCNLYVHRSLSLSTRARAHTHKPLRLWKVFHAKKPRED